MQRLQHYNDELHTTMNERLRLHDTTMTSQRQTTPSIHSSDHSRACDAVLILESEVIITAAMSDGKNNHVNSQSAFTFNTSVSELLTDSTMEQHLSICSISTNREQILCSGYNITLIKYAVCEFTTATQYGACNK